MFYYLDNERLQLWFFSPNVCAAFLTMTALLTLGVFLAVRKRKGIPCRTAAVVLFASTVIQFIGLSLTYSRGGYLAAAIALLLAAVCARGRWNAAFLLLFATIVLFTADGGARVKSIADVGEGSIRNRLWLWRGGAGIVAEHWVKGIGPLPAAGRYYTAWHQPSEINEHYYTLISDGLTIAASYGLFALFFLLAFAAFLLHQGGKTWMAGKSPFLLHCLAALAGYLVCGVFSTCYRFAELIWLPGCIALAILFFVAKDRRRLRIGWNRSDLWPPLLLPALICAALFVYGDWVNRRRPFRVEAGHVAVPGHRLPMLTATPASAPASSSVVFISRDLHGDARAGIRPLAEAGHRVIALETGVGLDALEYAAEAIRSLRFAEGESVFIVAPDREESLVAMAAAARMPADRFDGIVLMDVPFDWPFDELSPRRNLENISSPVIAIQRERYLRDGHALAAGDKRGIIAHVVGMPSKSAEVGEGGNSDSAGMPEDGSTPKAPNRGKIPTKGEVMADAIHGVLEKRRVKSGLPFSQKPPALRHQDLRFLTAYPESKFNFGRLAFGEKKTHHLRISMSDHSRIGALSYKVEPEGSVSLAPNPPQDTEEEANFLITVKAPDSGYYISVAKLALL